MRAIVLKAYGSPDNFQIAELEIPSPADDEVLLKVQAASINSWDWEIQRGTPFVNRILHGIRSPKMKAMGADVAGTVEAIGKDVTRFKPGDEVFGDLALSGWGSYAEYATAKENILLAKPKNLTFEEAAAMPQAGYLALRGICHTGELQPGQKVLLNGAGGGVGTIALQLAKHIGAEVTCVDRTDKLEKLASLGADHLIDYTKDDFTQTDKQYDLILDAIGRRSIFEVKRALVPGGIYAMVGGSTGRLLQAVLLGFLNNTPHVRKARLVLPKPMRDLAALKKLVEASSVVPVVDSVYPLNKVPEAFRQFEDRNFTGKIVISPMA